MVTHPSEVREHRGRAVREEVCIREVTKVFPTKSFVRQIERAESYIVNYLQVEAGID